MTNKLFVVTHGLSKHPIYNVWKCMRQRCFNKNHPQYPNYGDRGISVCRQWRNDPTLFIQWALRNGWKPKLQIDRKNNDKGYSPSNCRFVTSLIQQNNKRAMVVTPEIREIRRQNGIKMQAALTPAERAAKALNANSKMSLETKLRTAANARSHISLETLRENGRRTAALVNARRTAEERRAIALKAVAAREAKRAERRQNAK